MSNWNPWNPISNKPDNISGELHSRDVLLCYTKERIGRLASFGECVFVIGHVSNGHWRPRGGNGNFDKHFCAWMELPEPPNEQD